MLHISFGGPVYRFDGWLFEVHRWHGPHPLNSDGEPRKTPPGKKFWRMWEKFNALSAEEKEQYRV